jgi:hypothetical protein
MRYATTRDLIEAGIDIAEAIFMECYVAEDSRQSIALAPGDAVFTRDAWLLAHEPMTVLVSRTELWVVEKPMMEDDDDET